jgi:tetratricopeptide (TPR) repeat protein
VSGDEEEKGDTGASQADEAGAEREATDRGAAEPEAAERRSARAGKTALPPRVERALMRAREVARKDRERRAGRWLAIVPAIVAVVFLILLMPRATEPDSIPLPRADQRVLARIAREDDARAATAEAERLPGDVLAVGSAIRALNDADARDADEAETADARRKLEGALRELRPRDSLDEDLLALRAIQARRFLDALAHWEATGETTDDLRELGGNFVRRTAEAGWIVGRRVLFSEAQRRIVFKTVWNVHLGVESRPPFALSLDEQRELYVFYLTHPHPSDMRRQTLAVMRRDAKTPEACARVAVEERRAAELWRAEKIQKLGQIDPSYPTGYALGVAYYHAGRYDQAAEAFSMFIRAHPNGPYTLRAKNHLKAAIVARDTF